MQNFDRRSVLVLGLAAVATSAVVKSAEAQTAPIIPHTGSRSGGFPDASNTGPAAGTLFTTVNGLFNTSANGQLVEKLNVVNGSIIIHHSNVIIRDCIINCDGFYAITNNDEVISGMLVERVRIIGQGGNAGISLGNMSNAEVRFCDISHFENGIFPGGPAWNIHDNYIHDLSSIGASPHVDGIQISGDLLGTMSVTIRHNTISSWDTSCIILGNGNWNGIVIDNNRLVADPLHPNPPPAPTLAYGILCSVGAINPGVVTNVTITNNRITSDAIYPIFAEGLTNPVTIAGNVYDATGAAISPTIAPRPVSRR
jgi:hypothetical protein